jgi:hypothetical protein
VYRRAGAGRRCRAEVGLHHRGLVTSPDQGQQHRDRRGLQAGLVAARRIVAAELGAQIHQQPGPRTQQPVTAQTPIGPDRPHNLVVDHPLDPEPGQRPNRLTLAALLAAQLQLGAVADGACGGPASWWRRCSSTCRRGNRSDAAKLVRSGCSLQPPRLLGVVGGPAARLGGAVAVALVGGAVAQVGIAVTVVGGAIAHIRGPLAGVGGACSASRARASAARTRASSGALAATRSRCTSWTTSWATSASLREDARARPRSCWNASSRVTPWVAATIPLACSIHTRLASAYRS